MAEIQPQGIVDTEQEDFDVRFEVLIRNMERMSNQIAMFTKATNAEPIVFDFDDENQAGKNFVFNPTESLTNGSNGKNLGEAELPFDDLFKDYEDCGRKVLYGVAKRVISSCTEKPATEQFQSIQRRYLRPENCEFLKAPRVNPELWDDLHEKTRSREVSFQAFQTNLIKGIIPVIMLTDKVVRRIPGGAKFHRVIAKNLQRTRI